MSGAASRVHPIVLLGDTRREELRRRLLACVAGWRGQWSAVRDSVEVVIGEHCEHVSSTAAAPALSIMGGSASHGPLVRIRAAAGMMASMLGVGSQTIESFALDGPQGAAREVQLETLRRLCHDLLSQAGVRDPQVESPSADVKAQTRYSASAAVQFGGARPGLHFALTPNLVAMLAPAHPGTQRPAEGLARRNRAIGDELVRIEAVLGDIEISLSDLTRLEAGDVIVLERPLTGAGQFATPDGARFANVALGSSDGRRAVRLAGGSPGDGNI